MYARWLALLATAALALYICWLMLLPFVNVLAWAAVLVILFHPIHQRLTTLTGQPGWSALLSTVIVIGTIDNILRPKLVGERARLHELLIFFSVLGGLQIWGVLGLVLGPVIIAITLALLDIFRQMDSEFRVTPIAPPIVVNDRQRLEEPPVAL